MHLVPLEPDRKSVMNNGVDYHIWYKINHRLWHSARIKLITEEIGYRICVMNIYLKYIVFM